MKLTDDDFQYWLAHMDDALDEFFAMLPPHVRHRLDYSVDSLDVLEAWLLERYPNPDSAIQTSETLLLDGAARYIGETFCKTLGGRWWVDPKGEIMGGIPLIIDCRTGHGGDAPLSLATTATDRRRGNLISGRLRNELRYLSGRERPPYIVPPSKRKKNKKTLDEAEFDYWLSLMDRALAELFAALPERVRERLDYTPASLDVLEAWLLDRYPDAEAARAETEVLTLDGVARYIGETLRKHLGGRWWFDLDGWTHDGLPQLAGLGPGQASVCPLALAREAVETRSGNFLGTVLGSHRVPGNTDRAESTASN